MLSDISGSSWHSRGLPQCLPHTPHLMTVHYAEFNYVFYTSCFRFFSSKLLQRQLSLNNLSHSTFYLGTNLYGLQLLVCFIILYLFLCSIFPNILQSFSTQGAAVSPLVTQCSAYSAGTKLCAMSDIPIIQNNPSPASRQASVRGFRYIHKK